MEDPEYDPDEFEDYEPRKKDKKDQGQNWNFKNDTDPIWTEKREMFPIEEDVRLRAPKKCQWTDALLYELQAPLPPRRVCADVLEDMEKLCKTVDRTRKQILYDLCTNCGKLKEANVTWGRIAWQSAIDRANWWLEQHESVLINDTETALAAQIKLKNQSKFLIYTNNFQDRTPTHIWQEAFRYRIRLYYEDLDRRRKLRALKQRELKVRKEKQRYIRGYEEQKYTDNLFEDTEDDDKALVSQKWQEKIEKGSIEPNFDWWEPP